MLKEFQGTEEEMEQILKLEELAEFEWKERLEKYIQTKKEEKENPPTQETTPETNNQSGGNQGEGSCSIF